MTPTLSMPARRATSGAERPADVARSTRQAAHAPTGAGEVRRGLRTQDVPSLDHDRLSRHAERLERAVDLRPPTRGRGPVQDSGVAPATSGSTPGERTPLRRELAGRSRRRAAAAPTASSQLRAARASRATTASAARPLVPIRASRSAGVDQRVHLGQRLAAARARARRPCRRACRRGRRSDRASGLAAGRPPAAATVDRRQRRLRRARPGAGRRSPRPARAASRR